MTVLQTLPTFLHGDTYWPGRCPPPNSRCRLQIDPQISIEFEWGLGWAFGTAAYWISQYLLRFGQSPLPNQAWGSNLLEETAACLLGGYGVPAEVAATAYLAVREAGLLEPNKASSAHAFNEVLQAPLTIMGSNGSRQVRYRFAAQRAERLAAVVALLTLQPPPVALGPVALRDWLLRLPGVGYKTASWIVRNQAGTSDVAIVDIHLQRAGIVAGFFSSEWTLPRDYLKFERAFLAYADQGKVPASGLDALIWEERRIVTAKQIALMRCSCRGESLRPVPDDYYPPCV